ncbi:MAG: hypothetical protein ACKO7G_06530 [Gammaproteobacteria bacterium]
MRVTDDRYSRDRLRLELALRLIGHEARTHTIRLWTGLSDDRIRKLFRAYIRPSAGVRRRRGKSPQQAGFFVRGGAGAEDAQALAAMLLLFGVVAMPSPAAQTAGAPIGTRRPAAAQQPSLARGRLLCEAFETYRRIVPQPRIDFEHAVYLADALQRGDELRLRWCADCEAVGVTERATLRPTGCRCCGGTLAETPTQRSGPRDTGRLRTH